MSTTYTPDDVAVFEHATWSRCAPGYLAGFGMLAREAVLDLLDAAEVRAGTRLLDVGTGPGIVAAAARDRGAEVVGVDFSEAMIAEARRVAPGIDFRAASADALPFAGASFDAVTANLVLHHLGDPGRALAEARRVLRPDGRIACTVWGAIETLEAFGLFFAAVEQHAGSADLPHGPLFGVSDADTLASLFTDAGFSHVTVDSVAAVWRMGDVDELLAAFAAWAQLDTFPPRTSAAIEETVRSGSAAYRTDAGLAVPNPMVLVAATRTG